MDNIPDTPISTAETSIASGIKTVFVMADYGHDPTETAVPYTAFKTAGYDISFVTESGKAPECDKKMLSGVTQKLLGAKKEVVSQYKTMSLSPEFQHPKSWSDPSFSLEPYDIVIFPGGHDKAVRQVIDSPRVQQLVAEHFPRTQKPSKKIVGAVCHGVMVLSSSRDPATGHSVIRSCDTTALPSGFEQSAYWGTRVFLGDYYKTYGAGSEDVQTSVTKVLASPSQFKSTLNPGPFIVEDEHYNYISARYPGDAQLFSEEIIKLVESFNKIV
ncbi:class I glutamine amidotransferase-like protein [Microdochium trichocladiopsis]|uniref:Class I glutamine amidotransferase-like protein n=1 Tax=Microdochium trichocladiopsis TaxID=1682393 RepID=A0A9P8XTL8_9PEZI|nr:class I glutamine amidotransferase-like protein [Microdochium trichocladiopsis]KAH7018110.1 class I glutamine amidotransferase-like protein [Microdochium trichocladiopsis]